MINYIRIKFYIMSVCIQTSYHAQYDNSISVVLISSKSRGQVKQIKNKSIKSKIILVVSKNVIIF